MTSSTEQDVQAEAQLALHGLENAPAPSQARVDRIYSGPREPEPLLSHLGYDSFRPGQREAVAAALDGRDSTIVMPTGGGKSVCYQLPGLADERLTIVVSPLIALMADQWLRLREGGHPATMIASGLGENAARDAMARVRDGRARIVYCSPERFGSSSFLEALGRREVSMLAVDEAHCLSEWGHDFRPDYLRLPRAIERLGRPTVMACTATATEEVAAEISSRLDLRDPLVVRSGFDRPNLSFDIVRLDGKGSKARKFALLEIGLKDPANRPAIVYCGTRRDTDEVAQALRESGISAGAYHAGLAPDERASTQHRFMQGDCEVVVATNAFGMGVDKADVRSVWHWAIPTSVEAYYQEAGRAGRDGEPARAVLLAMRSDLGRLVRFNEQKTVDPAGVAEYVRQLAANAGEDGALRISSPRTDAERIRLAVAERIDSVSIEPAPGGRLDVTIHGPVQPGPVAASCRVAKDRGWSAYRSVEAFSYSTKCRRRLLLDHFSDTSTPEPTGRCCDVCDPAGWLPDPESILITAKRKTRSPGADVVELSAADGRLFETLREWRRAAAAGKPAYTVANDRTLEMIAVKRPTNPADLQEIKGVGPGFISKYAEPVLELIAAA